ncbi:MAG: molybdopterin-dependent oxidoreductase [Myxococcales bacterium]
MESTTKVTFCRICEASCGLLAQVEGQRVLKLAPDPEHVVSRGFVCVKGVRYTEIHHSPDRLSTPLKRVGGRYQEISWEQAFEEIGAKVRSLRAQHGNDSVGMYVGNPAPFSPPHMVFAGAFNTGLKTRHLYTSGSQDCNNKFVVAQAMFGSPLLQAIPDIDHAHCVIMVGTNPAISQLSMANAPRVIERLKGVTKREAGRVVFVNPRHTESSQQLGEHWPIRPGADVFFFLAFLHVLLAEHRPSSAQRALVSGVEELERLVAAWSPERVEPLTGIGAAPLRALVRDYVGAESAVLYAGTGVNQGPHGTLSFWLLTCIQILSGHFDQLGSMLMTRQQQRTARLGYPTGDAIPVKHSRFGAHASVIDSLPAGVMADEILTAGPGQLRAMFVTAGNPLLSCPNEARMREALGSLELLVCIDLFRNETGNLAHYLLPATSFLERSDMPMGISGYQPVPYAQVVEPVVEPLGQAKDEWWIFAQLGRVCRAPFNGAPLLQWWLDRSVQADSWLPRLMRFAPSLLFLAILLLERLTPKRLRKHPHGLLLKPHQPTQFLRKGVLNAEKRARLAPPAFLAAARELDAHFDKQLAERDKLLLITKREKRSHNSWMHNSPSLGGDTKRGANHLSMHPEDAARRGITDGDLCELRAAGAALRVVVRTSEDMLPNSVALPHGWGHAQADGLQVARQIPGVNPNLLAADGAPALEPLSGMSRLTAFEVELHKLSDAE